MNEFRNSIEEAPEPAPSSISAGDVYHVLFRHKWKIVIISALAVIAAAVYVLLNPPFYKSEAKVLIRYVQETKTVTAHAVGNDSQIVSPDTRGESVINTEMEILSSLDLAREVAAEVGPENLLGKGGGSNDLDRAATAIARNLLVQAPGKGNVIRMVFQHKNPAIIQPVLRALMDGYRAKHVAIHQAAGILDEFLKQQTEKLREELLKTQQDLAAVKNNAGIVSLEETKKNYALQISRIEDDMLEVEAELAQRRAVVTNAQKAIPQSQATEVGSSPDKVAQYNRLVQRLEALLKQHDELLGKWKEEHPVVQATWNQIIATQEQKRKMEQENPKLATLAVGSIAGPVGTNGGPFDLRAEIARMTALETKMDVLKSQLTRILASATNVNQAESLIAQLERRKEALEAELRGYSSSLEQSHAAEALGAGKININEVQSPSPPMRDSAKLKKMVGMILGLGIAGAIALAFLIEWFLDPSIKRTADVEAKLQMPVFLSIRDMDWKGPFRLFGSNGNGEHRRRLRSSNESGWTDGVPGKAAVATWDRGHSLRPYYEVLRDRLLSFFEGRNMTRKPKLVAVTGCSEGSGVTTLASGLAAALSETGDGNVLLVDMNLAEGAAHPFHRGKPQCALPDVLEDGKRDAAMVQENLYMVSASAANDKATRLLPKNFTEFFPKFKASDYDYIIFDMPAVTETSMTPRLAAFMDAVLLVVESEKSNRHAAKRATELLSQSKPNLLTILNKTKTYVPKWLHQEF